jgi:hypothetical protein
MVMGVGTTTTTAAQQSSTSSSTTTGDDTDTQDKDDANEDDDSSYEDYTSVVEQYAAATLGNLLYTPLQGPGYERGILQVNMAKYDPTFQIANTGIQTAIPTILQATAETLGVTELTDIVDHIIFCLPNDSLLGGTKAWTAFTYLYEPYTYYQRSRCTKLSVVVHELGHSLGFRHSGVPTNVYADETGPMGYSVNQYGTPRKGFNSHKNWIAGWYQHYSVHLKPLPNSGISTTTYTGRLASLPDATHARMGKEVALLRLGKTLYVQYNRAKGFHKDTGTPDVVTIVYAPTEEDASTRMATLDVGDVYRYESPTAAVAQEALEPNDQGGDKEEIEEIDENEGLVIAVCSMGADPRDGPDKVIDYAELVIQWRHPLAPEEDDWNAALCNLRGNPAVSMLTFGVPINHNDPSDNRIDVDDLPQRNDDQSTNDKKERALLIAAVVLAAIGFACLTLSVYLMIWYCRKSPPSESNATAVGNNVKRPGTTCISAGVPNPLHSPASFETSRTSSTTGTSWVDDEVSPSRENSISSKRLSRRRLENEFGAVAADVNTSTDLSTSTAVAATNNNWWDEVVDGLKKFSTIM